jgi:hypothetical protein
MEGFAGMRAWRMRKVPDELNAELVLDSLPEPDRGFLPHRGLSPKVAIRPNDLFHDRSTHALTTDPLTLAPRATTTAGVERYIPDESVPAGPAHPICDLVRAKWIFTADRSHLHDQTLVARHLCRHPSVPFGSLWAVASTIISASRRSKLITTKSRVDAITHPYPSTEPIRRHQGRARWAGRSWAIELAERQITVNVVAPDPTETPMLIDPARVATPPKLPRQRRYIQPGEIADLVAFLLGPGGRSITGQRLVVCAGASL